MITNLERYQKELGTLIERGALLSLAMLRTATPEAFKAETDRQWGKDAEATVEKLPDFPVGYQSWYSEAKALIRQLLPDRLGDFVGHYEAPKGRKELDAHSYRIVDFLLRHAMEKYGEVVANVESAVPHFEAQLAIVRAVETRFASALYDIRQLVQADLFDSELDAARSLIGHGYGRAAGAMAGVVLEHHLAEVCGAHHVTVAKKNPTIAEFNEALKAAAVIEVLQWRFIQHLADIRNKCDHKKSADPTPDEVTDLVDGVAKIIKTVR